MNQIQKAAALLGRKGGQAGTGKVKTRTSAHYSLAAKKSWEHRGLTIREILNKCIQKGNPDDCWPWTWHINSSGYGDIRIGGRLTLAHRLTWEDFHGKKVPKGMEICHSCDDRYPQSDTSYRRCCNYNHLWLGTHAQNMADAKTKGRTDGGRPAGFRWSGKLNDADILLIRQSYPNKPQSQLAKQFGVDPSCISKIVHRVLFKNV